MLRAIFKVSAACLILSAASLWGFVSGGRNVFWNASSDTISIHYRSSTIGSISTRLARGTSLNMSNDSGEVLSLRVVYPHKRALAFAADELIRIRASSHVAEGVWWITDNGVQFVRTGEAAREGHKLRSR
jgi:hypothetical protein